MTKLVLVIANRDIEKPLSKELVAKKIRFTRIASTGGFLRKKNITLLIGIQDKHVNNLVATIKKIAHTRSSLIGADTGSTLTSETGMPDLPLGAAPLKVGGATVLVIPADKALSF